jgi:hypothetical protein
MNRLDLSRKTTILGTILGWILFFQSQFAFAQYRIDLVGAAVMPIASGTSTTSGKLGIPGLGAILNLKLGSHITAEAGWLYLTRNYTTDAEYTIRMHEFLAGFKIRISSAFFANLGAYQNYYITNIQNLTGYDAGAYGGVGLKIPLKNSISFQFNSQYHRALTSLKYGADRITPHEIVTTVGFSFTYETKY